MKIEVLGTGCPKCDKLAEMVTETANELGLDYKLEKIQDLKTIMQYGVMITPALVIDGQVKISGKVPSRSDLKNILS